MFAKVKLADMADRVKSAMPRQRDDHFAMHMLLLPRTVKALGRHSQVIAFIPVQYSNRPLRTRMPSGGGWARSVLFATYPAIRH